MASTDDNNARWHEIREQGLARFVIVQGVLKWGLGTAMAWLLLMTIFTGGQFDYAAAAPRALIIFPVFGVLFGLSLWFVFQRLDRRT